MTDREIAERIQSGNDFVREVYMHCLGVEQGKVTPDKLRRPEQDYSPERVEARAFAQTRAVITRMAERAGA